MLVTFWTFGPCDPCLLLKTAGVIPWRENKTETATCAGLLIWSKLLPTSNSSNRRTRKNQRKKKAWFKRHFLKGQILFGCFTAHKYKSPTIYYQWHSTVPVQASSLCRVTCSGESRGRCLLLSNTASFRLVNNTPFHRLTYYQHNTYLEPDGRAGVLSDFRYLPKIVTLWLLRMRSTSGIEGRGCISRGY